MRLALLGSGEMGSTHANAYARFRKEEGLEIAGVVSRKSSKARHLAKQLRCPWSTNPKRVLRDDSIDAVDVTVPSGMHRTFVVEALANGKHVFCETPMALTLADADAMIAASRANRRILMVAQVMRFVSNCQHAHAEVSSHRLGKPRVIVARRLTRPYWSSKRPRPFRIYGEPLVELSIHDFDLANWILGRPRSVQAAGIMGPRGVAEHAFVDIAYRGGGHAFVEGSAMMPPGFPFTTALRVICEHGVLDQEARFLRGPIPTTRYIRYTADEREAVRVRGWDPYHAECRHFVRSVRKKADPAILSPWAERDALRIALAAKQSIRTGRRVALA
jgi:UDP-N-acetylglucosamine 3-dehydrogenase